jgi:hypothetical protein
VDRTVEVLDVAKPEHAGFMFDLAMACKDQLLDDYSNDIIVLIEEMGAALAAKQTTAFICKVDATPCAMVWVNHTPRDIGEITAAMMPEFRKGLGAHAYYFLSMFVPYCFDSLNIRKLRALIPITNNRPEKLLRKYGFRKVGLHQEETVKNGIPQTVVELSMTRNQYKGRKHERK